MIRLPSPPWRLYAPPRADEELVVDLFAGGGGASTGIEAALRRSVDVAVNHDPAALALHRANHPLTEHHPSDVFEVCPRKVTRGRPVGLLWASPDCTYHSKARGAKPIRHATRKRRALAWVITRWAGTVAPRVILAENVEEVALWGPLIAKRDPTTGRVLKTDGTVAAKGERVPVQQQQLVPDVKRAGQTYRAFVRSLRAHGYVVESKEIRAASTGHPVEWDAAWVAPTIRKRWYMAARRDGQPIVWPEPTHGAPESGGVKSGRLLPFRTAGGHCIDFTIPMLSIFATKEEAKVWGKKNGQSAPIRPLADATMRRIARGVKRYVIDNPNPFLVHLTHHGEQRGHSLDGPVPTVTGAQRGEMGIVAPVIAECANASADRSMPADAPLRTQCAQVKGGHFSLVAPYLVPRYGERDGQQPRARAVDQPAPVVVPTGNGAGLVAAHLATYHGEKTGAGVRGSGLAEPVDTLDCTNRHALVAAFLAQNNGGFYNGDGHPADAPASTILNTGSHQSLCTAGLIKLRGTSSVADAGEPLHTLSAEGTHHGLFAAHLLTNTTGHAGAPADGQVPTLSTGGQQALAAAHLTHLQTGDPDGGRGDMIEPMRTVTSHSHAAAVYAFLQKYYGTDQDPRLDESLHTVTTKDRFGVVTVTVNGEPMVIADIAMRMLQPRELYNAQGFPAHYIIDHGVDEHGNAVKLTKTEQVRMCGNSVCPPVAAALAAANVPEMIAPPLRRARRGRTAPLTLTGAS